MAGAWTITVTYTDYSNGQVNFGVVQQSGPTAAISTRGRTRQELTGKCEDAGPCVNICLLFPYSTCPGLVTSEKINDPETPRTSDPYGLDRPDRLR